MKDGTYKVIDFIHVYSCWYGQLKIPAGKIVTVKDHRAYVDDINFTDKLLDSCENHLKPISLETELRDLARQMKEYPADEYPYEWNQAADKWNKLWTLDKELARKLIKEYGI